jgi:acyl-CoA synthetase (AMP-forming)/AMP-acid ligase II
MQNDHANLAGLLWDAAREHADRTAVTDREQTVDYDRLKARAAGFAASLAARAVKPGDRVAILLERSPDAIAAIFGTHAVGGMAVVINERFRPRQIEHVVNHADVALIVTSRAMLDRLHRDLDTTRPILDVADVPESADFAIRRRISPDPAQIIYTSGSTGLPKGVVFSNGALRAGIAAVISYLGLESADRVATLLPFSSVYGLNQVLTAVAVGASVIIERSPVPRDVVTQLAAQRATVLAAVPPLWNQLLTVPDFQTGALRGLRIAQNAGGHLPPELVRRVRSALPETRLFLQYGMTETFRGTFLPPEEVDRRPGSMGRAMPDTEILLLDEEGRQVSEGEVGEIVHRGSTIALGYWNDPEATSRIFRSYTLAPEGIPSGERVVFSGDMARVDAEGFLYYVGRRDRVIKSMGFRIGPDEVADVLYASGQVHEAVIVANADPARGQRIIAHVVLRDDGSLDRLKRHCRAELPEYAQPAEYVPRDEIPRLQSGKYDIEALSHGADAPPS